MRKSLLCAALLGLSASSASAQSTLDNNMRGSDTLFDVMNQAGVGILRQLEAAGTITPGEIVYSGTGSGNGETDLEANFQEFAPMSRFLDAAACANTMGPDPGCWVIGLDGIAIASDNTEDTTCDVLRYSGIIDVTADLNGDGTTEADYSITNWKDVLRIIYGGQQAPVAASICGSSFPAPTTGKDCNTDVRRTLVNTWANMFDGACTDSECAAGLKHAWRRDDASGTTAYFLEALSLPLITATPFCNGTDAGTATNLTTADADPIRRTCDANEQICTGVGAQANTNGLVLPIKVPACTVGGAAGDPYFANTTSCTATTFSAGPFIDVQVTIIPAPTTCPNGAPLIAGTCKTPKREGTGTGSNNANCMSHAGQDPPGTPSPATFDARVYNLTPRNSTGTAVNNACVTAMKTSPWYRMHATRANTGGNVTCRENDATDQIGCLVNASPCTIGFAGAEAVGDAVTPDPLPTRKGLGIRSDNGTVNTFPTNAEIASSNCSTRYTLSRNLYMCTIDDFLNTGSQASVGSGKFLESQTEIKNFFLTNQAGLETAVGASGFVLNPIWPPQFIGCP